MEKIKQFVRKILSSNIPMIMFFILVSVIVIYMPEMSVISAVTLNVIDSIKNFLFSGNILVNSIIIGLVGFSLTLLIVKLNARYDMMKHIKSFSTNIVNFFETHKKCKLVIIYTSIFLFLSAIALLCLMW